MKQTIYAARKMTAETRIRQAIIDLAEHYNLDVTAAKKPGSAADQELASLELSADLLSAVARDVQDGKLDFSAPAGSQAAGKGKKKPAMN